MRIRPIDKRLLIHQIIYEEFEEEGPFGGGGFAQPLPIDRVRVEPSSSFRQDSNGEEIALKATVFLDAKNTPLFRKLKEKSKVTFGDDDYRVHQCQALFALDGVTPHHYEVELQ
ncbi:putative minor capsid protein [Shouchella lehensis]|uniref:Minor capsid protein n=1 Tax=Shouchella lehensis TaxID=300825 RepID=A0A4Y7WI92_9BACI|nr:putative minor capsid protein [Shouchella lehensis]MBG9785625.1 hypothetical protein [Shouchella lehensis]TES48079.1 minor capsid protein [Shouchella lehensis]